MHYFYSLKKSISLLFKLLYSIELYSTTQNKSIEFAIELIKRYRYSNGLEYILLSIKLMLRIINWKHLIFFKADKNYNYEHKKGNGLCIL